MKDFMTDTLIQPTLELHTLPDFERTKIFNALDYLRQYKGHTPVGLRNNYKKIFLPLGGSGMVMAKALNIDSPIELPTHLEFKQFHAPNLLYGHNLLHGTSVYASGMAFFIACKIWLATLGIQRRHIDALTLELVFLRGVDLTALRDFLSAMEAEADVRMLGVIAKAAGRTVESHDSTNKTQYICFGGTQNVNYAKTDLKHCKLTKDETGRSIKALGQRKGRNENKMREKELLQRGLTRVTAWKDAHQNGLYRDLYEEWVQKALSAGMLTRTKKPYPQAIESALAGMTTRSTTGTAILDFYFEGNNPRDFVDADGSPLKTHSYYRFRRDFKKSLGVDLDVPWATAVEIARSGISDRLGYPGDYHPPEELADHCFCEASWPAKLADLLAECEKAFEQAAKQPIKAIENTSVPVEAIDPETGEILVAHIDRSLLRPRM
jgi:hypothetical protein